MYFKEDLVFQQKQFIFSTKKQLLRWFRNPENRYYRLHSILRLREKRNKVVSAVSYRYRWKDGTLKKGKRVI